MNIAVIAPLDDEPREPSLFAKVLRESGHRVETIGVSPHQRPIEPRLMRGIELAFFQGITRFPFALGCALVAPGVRMACPPLHTLAVLDHPLHWRRVLEREGAPVSPWLLLGADVDVSREPKVSVLGFPLRVSPALAGSAESMVAHDREELAAAASALANCRGVIVQRCSHGDVVPVYTGLSIDGPVPGLILDHGRATLTLGLARHIQFVLELAGPCALTMVWERGRLLLDDIGLIADLGPQGSAFGAMGGSYPAFVERVVAAAVDSPGITP